MEDRNRMDPAPLRLMADEARQPETGAGSRRRFLRRATFGGIAAVGATALPVSVLTAAAQSEDTTGDTTADTSGGDAADWERVKQRLVQQDPGVGQRQALALAARRQQHRRRRGPDLRGP